MLLYKPKILSIMPTGQCTASCQDCGSFSHPRNKTRLPTQTILAAIDQANADGIEVVVFTGGEATLRWDALIAAIKRASDYGMITRLVSNAWWATTSAKARSRLSDLVTSGLREINFSTGDEHARFVALECVVNAIDAALHFNLSPIVMVELRGSRRITEASIRDLEYYKRKLGPRDNKVKFIESPWMPLNSDLISDLSNDRLAQRNNLGSRPGCDNILSTHTIQANGDITVCCGLGIQQVSALTVGNAVRDKYSFEELGELAESDLVKLLIRELGPERLLALLSRLENNIDWENKYAHKCHACIRVFKDTAVLAAIQKHEAELLGCVAASMALGRLASIAIEKPRPMTS